MDNYFIYELTDIKFFKRQEKEDLNEIMKEYNYYWLHPVEKDNTTYWAEKHGGFFWPLQTNSDRKRIENIRTEDIQSIWNPLELIAEEFLMYHTVCEKYPNFEHNGIKANAFHSYEKGTLNKFDVARRDGTFSDIKVYTIQFCRIPEQK